MGVKWLYLTPAHEEGWSFVIQTHSSLKGPLSMEFGLSLLMVFYEVPSVC